MVLTYLKHTPNLQRGMEDLKESVKDKLIETTEYFSILRATKKARLRNPPEYFKLSNASPVKSVRPNVEVILLNILS